MIYESLFSGTWISRWGNLMEWGPGSIRPSELEKVGLPYISLVCQVLKVATISPYNITAAPPR